MTFAPALSEPAIKGFRDPGTERKRRVAENYRAGMRRSTDEGSGLPLDDVRTSTKGSPRVQALDVCSGHVADAAPADGRPRSKEAERHTHRANSPVQGRQ
jgi:hypothetical protein